MKITILCENTAGRENNKICSAEFIYPMHCVDFPTLAKFHSIFGIEKLSTGDKIEFDNYQILFK